MLVGNTLNVLLVEDDPADAHITRQMIEREGSGVIRLTHVHSLGAALAALREAPPSAILLDLGLPDATPRETLECIVENSRDVPIVVLTGHDDAETAIEAVQNGAQDYLLKGEFSGRALERAIQHSIERHRVSLQIEFMALHDQLTGLPNRNTFYDRLDRLLATGHRTGQKFAIHLVDLDLFKDVNDNYGHATGDDVLQQSAQRLTSVVREADTVARLGGDEFAVLQTGVEEKAQVAILAERIVTAFDAPFHCEDADIVIGATVGTATFDDDSSDGDELLKFADHALYAAKYAGRRQFRTYDSSLQTMFCRERHIERRILHAIENDLFYYDFQPVVDLVTGDLVAIEALLRWTDPEHGPQSPATFIPILEAQNWLDRLNTRCFDATCEALGQLRAAGWTQVNGHINLAPQQFGNQIAIPQLGEAMTKHKLEPGSIVVELTETTSSEVVERHLVEGFSHLADMGILLAADDFGTGYATLRTLQKYPFDTIKLDRCFIAQLLEDRVSLEIVRAAIDMGRRMGKTVVCEGIETEQQAKMLRELGARYAQGYHLGRPQPIQDIVSAYRRVQPPSAGFGIAAG